MTTYPSARRPPARRPVWLIVLLAAVVAGIVIAIVLPLLQLQRAG